MRMLDTDILIDLIRQHYGALTWFATLTDRPIVCGLAALELTIGCQNKAELIRVQKFLGAFTLVWPAEADMNRALIDYAPLKLSHGIGGIDALIAATATGHGFILATFNTKHFGAIPGLVTEQPYIH